jgi:hypothetical protein
VELRCSHCAELIESAELKTRPGPGATAGQLAEGVVPTR